MKEKEKKRVTISDIAREAGVSKTAVSFAFNTPERISKETREKILRTAEKLKYIPDPMARNFSLGKHLSLGFLLPQDTDAALANPYIVEVIRGLGNVCQQKGYTLTIIPPLNDSVFEAVKNATVDGLVTMGYILDEGVKEVIKVRAIPLVMIDGTESSSTFSINIDDEGAGYTQLVRVLEMGHRNVALVSLPEPAYQSPSEIYPARGLVEKRLEGYYRALREYGIAPASIPLYTGKATRQRGNEIAAEILSRAERPTAIVTMSDIVAIGIIQRLKQAGVRVPDDISVVGFDDIRESELIDPPLTTIAQPAYEKGIAAAETVFAIIDGRSVDREHCRVPFTFIQRDSLKSL